MKPVFAKAKTQPVRVIYAEGEDERVLRATQVRAGRETGAADPGRASLRGRGEDQAVRPRRSRPARISTSSIPRTIRATVPMCRPISTSPAGAASRPEAARTVVRTNATVIAALAVVRGEADAMICGVEGRYMSHLRHVREIVGFLPGVSDFAALAMMITSKGSYFIADTQVRPNPSAEELAEVASLAAIHVQRFNMKPRARASCHIPTSAAYDTDSSRKMRRATALLKEKHPEIEADGEMQGDTALSAAARKLVLPHSKLEGDANILIMPEPRYRQRRLPDDQDAGGRARQCGPILIGPARPAHILTPGVTARGVLNMTAGCGLSKPRSAPAVRSRACLADWWRRSPVRNPESTGSGLVDQGLRNAHNRSESFRFRLSLPRCSEANPMPSVHHLRADPVRRAVHLFGREQAVRHQADHRFHHRQGHHPPMSSRPIRQQLETLAGMPFMQLLAICVGAFEIIAGLMIALNFLTRFLRHPADLLRARGNVLFSTISGISRRRTMPGP